MLSTLFARSVHTRFRPFQVLQSYLRMPQISDDGSIGPDNMFTAWANTLEKISSKWGKPLNVWSKSRATLQRAGFVDIVEKRFKWPVNDWPEDSKLKQIGYLNKIRTLENIEAFTMRLLTGPGNVRFPA